MITATGIKNEPCQHRSDSCADSESKLQYPEYGTEFTHTKNIANQCSYTGTETGRGKTKNQDK